MTPEIPKAQGLLPPSARPMATSPGMLRPEAAMNPQLSGVRKVSRYKRAEQKLGGGRFKLTVLLQKRAVELMRGAPPLVKIESKSPKDIALEEILAGKIELTGEEPAAVAEPGPEKT